MSHYRQLAVMPNWTATKFSWVRVYFYAHCVPVTLLSKKIERFYFCGDSGMQGHPEGLRRHHSHTMRVDARVWYLYFASNYWAKAWFVFWHMYSAELRLEASVVIMWCCHAHKYVATQCCDTAQNCCKQQWACHTLSQLVQWCYRWLERLMQSYHQKFAENCFEDWCSHGFSISQIGAWTARMWQAHQKDSMWCVPQSEVKDLHLMGWMVHM